VDKLDFGYYNMDCMAGMKLFPDKYFDVAIVDPPYGINAPNMAMGTNKSRTKNGYPSESTASRLKRSGQVKEGGCFDGGRVYFDRNGVDQEGEERANWIDAVWCDGMNRDGLPAAWTYKTDIPCEHFDIWEDGEIYCVGLVFSIEDLK